MPNSEELLMNIVGILLACFFIFLVVKQFSWRPLSFNPSELIQWAFREAEVRRRIFITLAVLAAVKVASFLPLPGLDLGEIFTFFKRISHQTGPLDLFDMAKSFHELRLFGFGLTFFISACVLIQLGSVVVPAIRRAAFGGEAGRQKIEKWTWLLTMVLAIVSGSVLALWLEKPSSFEGFQIVSNPGWGFRFLLVLSVAAATFLLLAVASWINNHGLGNGVALIVVTGGVSDLISVFLRPLSAYPGNRFGSAVVLLLAGILMSVLLVVFYVTNNETHLELRSKTGAPAVRIPLRPGWVGREPLGFAAFIWVNAWKLWPSIGEVVPTLVAIPMLTLVTAYLYGTIIRSPKRTEEMAERYGYVFPSEDFKKESAKTLLVTGLVLILISNLPGLIRRFVLNSKTVSFAVGGTGVLFLVGVFFDLMKQLEFLKKKKESGIKNWAVCYVAPDEIEAQIKTGYLGGKGIPALVEPLRFTWGMPIRTAVDQYRIYTPIESCCKGRELILGAEKTV